MDTVEEKLFTLQDAGYREFQSKLMPGIDPDTVIGIRVPVLRRFSKQLAGTQEAEAFLSELPHRYYEENNLHMLLITAIRDYETCLAQVERFLPYIDNWATCDFPAPVCFAAHRQELLSHIEKWLCSGHTYTIRYGIGMLMRLYLDEEFEEDYLARVAEIHSDEYYVNMMIAWYFATALAKQWDATIPYLEQHRLSDRVHAKTIQKAIESYRITKEQKACLRALRMNRGKRTLADGGKRDYDKGTDRR